MTFRFDPRHADRITRPRPDMAVPYDDLASQEDEPMKISASTVAWGIAGFLFGAFAFFPLIRGIIETLAFFAGGTGIEP